MSRPRRLALVAGLLYLVTFATSIPALALKAPVLAGASHDAAGATILELLLAASCVGTAVALFPLIRGVSDVLALGFVTSRVLEAGTVLLGVTALLAIAGLPTGADEVRAGLAGIHDAAFLVGPGLIPAINALLLGGALWRGRLVPRAIPLIGLIGAPLLVASVVLTLLGVLDQVSPLAGLLALPIAVWEFGIGLWLAIRGVRTTPAESAEVAA